MYQFFKEKNITGDKFKLFDVRYITEKKANDLIRSKVVVGDILLVKIGSIGYSALLDNLENHKFAIIPANLAKISIDENIINKKYLLYWLKNDFVKSYLKYSATKTATGIKLIQKN